MSSFLLEHKTINRIATAVFMDFVHEDYASSKADLSEIGIKSANDLGHAMFDLNLSGLEQRYGDAKGFGSLEYYYKIDAEIDKFQLLKSLRCLLYQASEGNIPETNKLFKVLEKLSFSMALDIVSDMPSYKMAHWN